MLEQLAVEGVKLDPKRFPPALASGTLGRGQLAREMVRARAVGNIKSAFDRYLTRYEAEAPAARIPIDQAVELLHQAGGVAVLAHPPSNLTMDQWQRLVEAGVDGLETDYPAVSNRHRKFLEERVIEYGLVSTAGSDYHGERPADEMGSCSTTRLQLDCLLARRPLASRCS
jgi:predicted metal-dependent phosphoesterase TrpH